ncbi:tRNA lysidine(34) synthetase TilS [Fictibacillus aquaticus]|uniref:tRNA(Ile)-lysidine synthase n=1 Tax=Fictibacillus aquaticus TaxID=2021314 RepID=A0A235F6T4_9BACL|nr:tRNA lysidine(34) synthetase TilS [Fictibacillus aquaticus]
MCGKDVKEQKVLQEVERFISKHKMLDSVRTVVVGVSGGPDSLALLHYFWKLSHSRKLRIIAASADHGLRGEESATECRFVESFCREKDIIFAGQTLDVAGHMKRTGQPLQSAARELRYNFFAEVMNMYGAEALALGHHGDDQTETILMRLVRGSEGESLSGIRAVRKFTDGKIIRPFLCITKAEIEQYCEVNDIQPVHDPSNKSGKYTRNRYRQAVLPFLKQENPSVHKRFQQFSETISEDETYMMKQAESALSEALTVLAEKECVLSVPAFLKMPIPLQKRGITLILNYLYKQIPSSLSSLHKETFLALLNSVQPSGILHFPSGLRVKKSYDSCLFTFAEEAEHADFSYEIPIPGVLVLEAGELSAEMLETASIDRGKDVFVCASEEVKLPLTVRSRRAGDRMTLSGMAGSRKLKDIFIDSKIPQTERNIWPVVEDAEGNILWLPGLKHSALISAHKPAHSEKWFAIHFRKYCQDV